VTYWQQAMCVRLFFEFWTPFYRLLGARWDGIVDRRWYPYPLSERRLNLRYGGRIDEPVAVLLDRVRRLGTERFGPNPYWFPTQFGRKFGHIRTVDTIWRNTLCDIRARYFPLREMALSYRRWYFTCHRYGILMQSQPSRASGSNLNPASRDQVFPVRGWGLVALAAASSLQCSKGRARRRRSRLEAAAEHATFFEARSRVNPR
jgi:hypothetical protein